MKLSVLIECNLSALPKNSSLIEAMRDIAPAGLEVDEDYEPVLMGSSGEGQESRDGGSTDLSAHKGTTVVFHAWATSDDCVQQLQLRPEVLETWTDSPIEPFN